MAKLLLFLINVPEYDLINPDAGTMSDSYPQSWLHDMVVGNFVTQPFDSPHLTIMRR